MPAGIVFAIARCGGLGRSLGELGDVVDGLLHQPVLADDSHLVLHHLLQFALDFVGIFAVPVALQRFQCGFGEGVHLGVINFAAPIFLRKFRRVLTRALAENEQIRKRIPAQPICAV